MGTKRKITVRIVRRVVITSLIFLLLGVMVSVAVAWGCAAWSDDRSYMMIDELERSWETYVTPEEETWLRLHGWEPRDQWHAAPSQKLVAFGTERFGYFDRPDPGWSIARIPMEPFVIRVHAGWPMYTLSGANWNPTASSGVSDEQRSQGRFEGAFAFERQSRSTQMFSPIERRPIPFTPIWPGFTFSTLFYASILFVLVRGPFIARRIIRKRKGRCTRCGYDVRSSATGTCPECGTAVSSAQSHNHPAAS